MIDPDVNLETVGKLLALVAHDLRNPLSAIHSKLGFLSSALVDEGPSRSASQDRGEEVKDALSDGLISCEALTHMIDNLEMVGQVLRGMAPPSRHAVLAADLVQDAVTRCTPVAASYGIRLERMRSPADVARTAVLVSREQTCKALGNLVRNAIQHSSPGQTVTVALRAAEPGAANRVQVVVEDKGAPIHPGSMPTLFTAEGQVRAKGSSDGRYSRALGLYAARLGAELGGCKVSAVTHADSSGNCLILDLPAA
jgi:signal transduction histidine kinase